MYFGTSARSSSEWRTRLSGPRSPRATRFRVSAGMEAIGLRFGGARLECLPDGAHVGHRALLKSAISRLEQLENCSPPECTEECSQQEKGCRLSHRLSPFMK